MKNMLRRIIIHILSVGFYSVLNAQCPSVDAGSDQTICGGSATLNMTYTPVKAATSYVVAPIAYTPASFTSGTTAVATNVDDIYSSPINIGFCFNFYGNTYTQCLIGSNGIITFDLAQSTQYCEWVITSSDPIPTSNLQTNSIMAPYHDIYPSEDPGVGTSEIKYSTYGTAPCRTFVISWSNTPMFDCTEMIDNQQIILYESTNVIEIYIKDKPLCTSWNDGLAILGIQNASGTIATAVAGKNCTQWSATNEAYRFSPNGAEISTVSWLQGTTVIGTSSSITVSPTTTTTYTAQITLPSCTGNVNYTDNVDVFVSGGITTPAFTAIPPLCQGSPAPVLPASSSDIPPISGTWSSLVNTSTIGTTIYTFTPDAGQCASIITLDVTILPAITPIFDLIPPLCQGSQAPILPTSSTNTPAIIGTWSSAINTSIIGTTSYVFTPTSATCPVPTSISITITPIVIPTFSIGTSICSGTADPVLPTFSDDNPPVIGSWSPTPLSDTTNSNFIFTPSIGQCATSTSLNITVNPLPIIQIHDPSPVCSPLTINLLDPTVTAGSTIGTFSYYSDASCTIPLNTPESVGQGGTYYIKNTTDFGCSSIASIVVSIAPQPIANFTPSNVNLTAYNLTSTMQNNSNGANTYQWFFEDGLTSNEMNPAHTFTTENYGEQTILLIAISDNGCVDSITKTVLIEEELIYYIPNTFTPDGNKFNQTFQPVFTSGYDPLFFNMMIFDRWGAIVFQSNDTSIGWNGDFKDRNELLQDGVYSWKIEFKLKDKDKHISATGHLNLIR